MEVQEDKPTLLIDLDDTIWNMVPVWLLYINSKYDQTATIEDVIRLNNWDMATYYPNLNKDKIYNSLGSFIMWDMVDLKFGVRTALYYLKDKYNIFVVTATNPANSDAKFRRFDKLLGDIIPRSNIIIAYDKSMIKGDIIIDDYALNLQGDRKKRILFRNSYSILTELDNLADII